MLVLKGTPSQMNLYSWCSCLYAISSPGMGSTHCYSLLGMEHDISNSKATSKTEQVKPLRLLLCACSLVVWQLTVKPSTCQIPSNPVKRHTGPSGKGGLGSTTRKKIHMLTAWIKLRNGFSPVKLFVWLKPQPQLDCILMRSLQVEAPGKFLSRFLTLRNREA